MNRGTLASLLAVVVVLLGCGGGGASSPVSVLKITATFEAATRTVPGYVDTVSITIVPPEGTELPAQVVNPIVLTRASATVEIKGLPESSLAYTLNASALTDGVVVGTAQRSAYVSAGSHETIDISTTLNSQVASVGIDAPPSITLGQNINLVAYTKNAQGQMLFSGAGFAWESSNTHVLLVDPNTGFLISRATGSSTIKATLVGTTLKATKTITVDSNGGVTVAITPTSTSVQPGAQALFNASVTGVASQAVTWTVDEPTGGTITSSGQYTAPNHIGNYHVRATSQVDSAATATALVAVSGGDSWEVIDLDPNGVSSVAVDTDGVQFVGSNGSPAVWSGSPPVPVNLFPSAGGYAQAVDGGRQVGGIYDTNTDYLHAYMWAGTAASVVDLQPVGARASYAMDIEGDTQVGWVLTNTGRASIWHNTKESWTDLHPTVAGIQGSALQGLQGSHQVGYVAINDQFCAGLWTGTAASFVNLDPGLSGSQAWGVYSNVQVGFVNVQPDLPHAALWTGTAASWKDLNPAGASESTAYDVFGSEQVGSATFDGHSHAVLWFGLASWTDLHSLLPPGFTASNAYGMFKSGNKLWVVGSAYREESETVHAMVWIRTSP